MCVLDAAGEIVAREVIVNTPELLTAFCARYPGATLVMETLLRSRLRRAPPARTVRGSRARWQSRATLSPSTLDSSLHRAAIDAAS